MSSSELTNKILGHDLFKVTTEGNQKLKSLSLSSVEADAVLLAIQGTLGTEVNKRGKITKKVLCDALTKVVTTTGWFQRKRAGDDTTVSVIRKCEEDFNRSFEAAISPKATTENGQQATDTAGSLTVCKFYKVGRCKFSKKNGVDGASCPMKHPPTCRAFDYKGPDGCNLEPCPKGLLHRTVCAKLRRGDCLRKAGQCHWYHPPQLSKRITAEKKKKKEEEEKLEMKTLLSEMRSLRQAQFMPFPAMQYPFFQQPYQCPPLPGGKK